MPTTSQKPDRASRLPTRGAFRPRLSPRVAGAAAIAGGALRVVDAYIAATSDTRVQQVVYFVTDVLLLVALCGIFLAFRHAWGVPGHLGFLIAGGGLLIVRASALTDFGQNGYLVGATVTLVGVVCMGLVLITRVRFPRLGPAMWVASFAVGLLGLLSPAMGWAIVLAGVIFGAGFVAVGSALLRGDLPTLHDETAAGPA